MKIVSDLNIAKDHTSKTTLADSTKKYGYSGLITHGSREIVATAKTTSSNIKLAIHYGAVSLTLKQGFDNII